MTLIQMTNMTLISTFDSCRNIMVTTSNIMVTTSNIMVTTSNIMVTTSYLGHLSPLLLLYLHNLVNY